MQRRFLCLYFPQLAIDRLERENPVRRTHPFAVTAEEKGHLRIAAVNGPARQAGIVPRTRLTDARTLLPDLDVVADDPEANHRLKHRIVEWCDRYTPLVSHDGSDGILLDITGCEHLFGGEAALLEDLQTRLRSLKFRVRGAIADTVGAAWALARFGKRVIAAREELPELLDLLPVKALRLSEEITAELGRTGLATIGHIRKISRHSLTTRYGPDVVLRLDQALGYAEEPITPCRPPAPYRATRTFPEPIGSTASVEHVLLDLLSQICSRLKGEGRGTRQLDLDCCRVDGSVVRSHVRTSKPGRSITHLMRLFSEKLDSLDAGFGIETMILSASAIDPVRPAQMSLPDCGDGLAEDTSLDELLDRFGLRLGFEQVCRFRVRESLLPEYSTEFLPVTKMSGPGAEWPENRVRPVRLIEPPMGVGVSGIIPGGWPVQIRIGNQLHRIVRVEGPERLTPEWWRDKPLVWKTRDYYRVEIERGLRFWIFHEPGSSPDEDRWFLHGHLP